MLNSTDVQHIASLLPLFLLPVVVLPPSFVARGESAVRRPAVLFKAHVRCTDEGGETIVSRDPY